MFATVIVEFVGSQVMFPSVYGLDPPTDPQSRSYIIRASVDAQMLNPLSLDDGGVHERFTWSAPDGLGEE